jgi:predicted aminopeptidase
MTVWLRLSLRKTGLALGLALIQLALSSETLASSTSWVLSPAYYWQSVRGHLSLMMASRPIDEWLADPGVEPQLRQRLLLAREIRQFASRALALPDNGSFTRYADLGRSQVVWNVKATPEFSLQPLQWCFPVAGCVAYRGYYDEGEAKAFAQSLREQGLDVSLGGVQAYSTLGWFDDPLLNTFVGGSAIELARLIFHELAHQVVYVASDTRFNESFATAVEELGLERWVQSLEAAGSAATGFEQRQLEAWRASRARREQVLALLGRTREELARVYALDEPIEVRRAAKQAAFAQVRERYAELRAQWQGPAGYDGFFAQPLGNAHLLSVSLYNDWVPAFRALFDDQGQDFARFYQAVRELAALAPLERERALAQRLSLQR